MNEQAPSNAPRHRRLLQRPRRRRLADGRRRAHGDWCALPRRRPGSPHRRRPGSHRRARPAGRRSTCASRRSSTAATHSGRSRSPTTSRRRPCHRRRQTRRALEQASDIVEPLRGHGRARRSTARAGGGHCRRAHRRRAGARALPRRQGPHRPRRGADPGRRRRDARRHRRRVRPVGRAHPAPAHGDDLVTTLRDPPVGRSPELLWTAPAEAMALFAARAVELHGSMVAWPAALGVSAPTIERLRHSLLAER